MQRPRAIGRRVVALIGLALTGIAACAGSDPQAAAALPESASPVSALRLLVKPAKPLADTEQDHAGLAREASAAAGLPVRYAAAMGPDWHAIQLTCAAPAECDAAVVRLRAATSLFTHVERDERRRAHGL